MFGISQGKMDKYQKIKRYVDSDLHVLATKACLQAIYPHSHNLKHMIITCRNQAKHQQKDILFVTETENQI